MHAVKTVITGYIREQDEKTFWNVPQRDKSKYDRNVDIFILDNLNHVRQVQKETVL